MAFALVGTIGTAVTGAVGASVSPGWGTNENRTADNLLILTVSAPGGAGTLSTPSGWSVAKQQAGTTCGSHIFYKIAAGSDAAPTTGTVSGATLTAQLSEWSGGRASSPLDTYQGGASATSSPVTATFGGVDATAGELLIMCGADFRSVARSSNDTWTSNRGTVTAAANNNGTSSRYHQSSGYITSTSSNSNADTAIMTLSITTSITGLTVAAATFELPAASGSVLVDPFGMSGIFGA